MEIIETYWNVNEEEENEDVQNPDRNNRNILECK